MTGDVPHKAGDAKGGAGVCLFVPTFVIPAKAGSHGHGPQEIGGFVIVDSRFRGNDGERGVATLLRPQPSLG